MVQRAGFIVLEMFLLSGGTKTDRRGFQFRERPLRLFVLERSTVMANALDYRNARRAALVVVAALGLALGGCANTIKGAEKDSQKVFGTSGGSPKTGQNPTSSNAKGGWTNPQ